MAKYQKASTVVGAWLKGADVVSGTKCKLVSETEPQPSQFTDPKTGQIKMQNVAKIRFEGGSDAFNISLNRATINGLVDAFGEDSVAWQGNALTAQTEKVMVSGKRVTAVYLIPNGYEMKEDDAGYVVINKVGSKVEPVEIPVIQTEDTGDMPF